MEKKIIKYCSDLFEQEITMTIDEKLNNLDVKEIVSRKQDLINQRLEKIKDFLPQ